MKNGSYTKLLALFRPVPSGASLYAAGHQVALSLKTTDDFEEILRTTSQDQYKDLAGMDLSAMFMPYRSAHAPGSMPRLAAPGSMSGTVLGSDLLPFRFPSGAVIPSFYTKDVPTTSGDKMLSLISASGYLGPTDRYRELHTVRGIGLRAPLMLVGWGYSTTGKPIPSAPGGSGFLGPASGSVPHGWMVEPKDYVAAPVDIRYNETRGVWEAGGEGGDPITGRHRHLKNSVADGGPAFASFFADSLEEAISLGYDRIIEEIPLL